MKKNTVVISIPMQPADKLIPIEYKIADGNIVSSKTRFPGIAMLENFVNLNKETKIVTVRTNDENNRTEICYNYFKEELADFSKKNGKNFEIFQEIVVPYSEDKAKEKYILKSLFDCFTERSNVFLDLTYGTKLTSVEMFSSLFYAEIAKECSIKKIVYGKFSFDEKEEGELFDATGLYHKVRFLETAQFMEKEAFKQLVSETFT